MPGLKSFFRHNYFAVCPHTYIHTHTPTKSVAFIQVLSRTKRDANLSLIPNNFADSSKLSESRQHVIARPRVVDGGEVLLTWRVVGIY